MSAEMVRSPVNSELPTIRQHFRPVTKAAAVSTVDDVRDRMTSVCESAVDALEIAAALEADGLSDQSVRTRYGLADVFALAEHLYRLVPRRPAEPVAPSEPWRADPAKHVLHGFLYAVPAVCFPVAAPLLSGLPTLIGFVVSVLVSWALSQGLAYLGYSRVGQLDRSGSLRVLRGGLAVSVGILSAVLAETSLLLPARTGGLVFAGGQGSYLLAATVLMVCGKHRWLLGCLAPGAVVSTGFLLLGQPNSLRALVWWMLAATVLATVGCAIACTSRPGPGGATAPKRAELRGAAPQMLSGLMIAGLLVFPVVAAQFTGQLPQLAPLLATPLSLSMGAAEWSLYWYRQRTYRLLRSTRDVREFAAGARRLLLAVTARYLAAAAALIAAMAGLVAATGSIAPQWTLVGECIAFLMLGGALFVTLLLQAFRSDLVAPLACAAALATEIGLTSVGHLSPVSAQLLVCAGLTAALFAHAANVLSQPVRHW